MGPAKAARPLESNCFPSGGIFAQQFEVSPARQLLGCTMPIPNNSAVIAGDLVFVGGVGAVGDDGKLVGPGDPAAQTAAIVVRIEKTLRRAGLDLTSLVFVTVYLSKPDDYDAMNEAYARAIPAPYPARKCIVTPMFAAGRVVEMTAIASKVGRQIVSL